MSINKNDLNNRIKVLVPPLEYQQEIEITIDMIDEMDEKLNIIKNNTENNIKTAFLNSLDDFGNPNGFNIHKFLHLKNAKL